MRIFEWSPSDKLAVVLFCVAAAMALILFLVEKSPITVGVMIFCIAIFLVYPIFHFVKPTALRAISLAVMVFLVSWFGWSVWPKKEAAKIVEQVPEPNGRNQPPPQFHTEPEPEPKPKGIPKKGEKQKPSQKSQPPSITTGPISTGPCSNVQVGGSRNEATTNCGTPSRALEEDKVKNFASVLAKTNGTLRVKLSTTAEDAFPLSQQLCKAAEEANWSIACPMSRFSVMGKEEVVSGLACYANDWNVNDALAFKNAMEAANLKCVYHTGSYRFGNVQILGAGGVTILIGSR